MTMDALEIRVALLFKETSQAEIARQLGVTPGFVYQVIHRKRRNRRVREAVAEALGLPYKQIWPTKDDPLKVVD